MVSSLESSGLLPNRLTMPNKHQRDTSASARAQVHGLIAIPVLLALLLRAATAEAAVGLTEIAGKEGDGPVTVYYPSSSEAQTVKRGPFTFQMAWQGEPARGNRRLIVISHGSGGSPWVHADLARALVDEGFVVAMPEHRGDNFRDHSTPGPESWRRRPAEVSRAIDAVGKDSRFKPLLALDRVGVYGMSAGGHTALSLAGGRWSPARFREHCEAHIADDFYSCVGLALRRQRNFLDGTMQTIALWVIRFKFSDATWQTYRDPRVVAIVAAVPYAADFDMTSLAAPPMPLGLVTARLDAWLVPRFHGDAVLKACPACERIADVRDGGHGALLSPLPPGLTGLVGELLNDPPDFNRAVLPEVDRKIAAFFARQLLP
jgi:predicted dienelactone hydrolase